MNAQRVAQGSRWTLVLIAGLLFPVLALAQSPSITSISPSSGVVGMPVEISGSGFGATQGSSTVTLNGISASATSWSDGSITVIVPTGATSGPFSVTVNGQGASSASFTVNTLPSGWTDSDIGTVGLAGSASYANGTFTVKGAGAGIWSTADAFHFVYQSLSGNGSIVARVVNMPVGAVAGVMVRETLNAGAMNGKTADYLSSSTYAYAGFDIRTSTGGSTTEPSYVSGTLPPYWVELVRNGSTFSSYTSPDGINWTQLGSNQTIGMATNAYVGLGVSSRSTSSLATVTFDNVSVSSTSAPAPVISSISATTGNAGSQVVLNGSGFGSSQSTSLVTLNAAPVIINSWSATSITVTIPSSATTGLMVVSVGPTMNDSNPIWFTVTAQPLPSGWLDGDVGAVGKTGSAGYANGVFTVNGAGTNFAGTADAFHFVYQTMSGNGSIVARVVSAPVDSSAGVMVRETLNSGATNAITLAYPTSSTGGYINFDMRATTGGSLTNPAFISGPHPPYWVEVVRSGNTFSSYSSPDGINWTEIGSPETITMAQNVYVGLIVASGSTSSLATGTFDNVSVNSGTTSAPVITSVSATTGSVGSQVVINGSGFGASQGSSLVTLNAAPVTIDTWDNNAITVMIPSSATSGLLVVSLGPSMDDSNPVWFTVTTQPLPSGWLDGDIGAVGEAGSATYSSGVFTVNGAGTNIWGTADAFHFAYLPVTGNGTIIARVVSMPAGSQAGVMVRETLNAGATNAKTADHLVSGTSAYVDFDVRTSTGGSTSEPGYLSGTVPPYWVEVVRNGSTFSAYRSTNGTSWTQLGTNQTITMAQNAYVGLAVDSGNTTSLATATFDNVSSTFGAQIVAPSIAGVSPTSSVPLVPVTITGSNFGSSQGSSTVTFNGVAATPTSWNSTTIVAPVPLTATTGNVVVTVNGASSNGVAFTVSQTPTINTLSPSSGPVGTSVTINGVNFGSSQGSSTVTFNGMAATPTAWSATAIGVAVPTGATTGNVVVTVGGTASSGVPFTVYPIPSITSLSTSSATIGAPITITGNNFGSSAGTSTVTFNGVAATPTSWSSTSIVALVPFGATTGNVVVTENGIASNAVPITITMVSLPAVSQVLPANGSTGVPENSRIVVRFAQPVLQTAVIPGTVSLLQGTTPVSGTLTLSNDGLSVTFIPAQNLAATTAFNVSVTDLTGNQSSAEFQSSFTTGSTTDTVAPSLVQTSPQNSNTGVPISTPIVVQFSKAMDPGTLTPQTFTVADTFTGNAINGMVQVDPTGTTASFVPQPNLPVGRTFLVQLHTTIEDQAGNSLTSTGADTFSFTTSFTADTTAPQVVGMSPSNGATGVPLNSLIVLQFSKPLDVISVSQGLQVQVGGQAVPGAIALSSGNQLVTFTPTGGLAANTTYTISLTSQIADVGGLALANPQSFSLTTGAATDATTPSVATVSPQNSATGVPVNGIVQVEFSKTVDPFTVTTATLQVLVGNNSIVPGTISVSSDGLTATFTPSVTLSAFTIYQVEATTGITDPEGHPLALFQSRFTTGATTAGSAPTVQMISPPNGATGVPANPRIDVTVSTALDPATVSNSVIAVSTGGNPVAGTVTLGNGGMTVTWLPTTLLAASTNYSLTLSGVTDQAGNLLTPFTSSFTTAASGTANTTTPSVVSVSPANGATAVPASSAIVLTFNEAIDLTSVSDTTVPIQVSNLGAVAGSYALDSTGMVLTFTPLSPLPGNATVSVSVLNQGVLDLSGNLSGSYYSTFTTGTGTDTTSPTVTMVTPSNGATGITPNTPVVLTFSKSLNPNTVTAGNLAVLVNGTVQPEGISRSADNRVITLGGTSLPASSTVTVLATTGLTDLSGNPLVNFQSQFTTAATSVGPTVTSQRPGNGATLVPSTASVVLYLSQPMNASTLTGALHVSQNGVIVSGTTQVSDNGQVLQFFPSSSWLPSAVVQVFLDSSAQSVSGINLNAYQSSFTTGPNSSTTVPTQVATNPPNGQTLVPTNEVMDFAFNVPLDPNTLTADAVVCYQNGIWFQNDVGLIDGGTIIQIAPRYPLPTSTGISCQVSASLEGTNGVPLSGPTNLTFTTGTGPDTQLPTIQTASPPNGSTNVGDNAIIRLVFNKPINPLTVNATTVQLTGNGTTFVADSISFSNNNQMALLVPHSPLPDNTLMTLTISGITDGAGNPVAPQTTQFTTGAGPDVVAPLLVLANPHETNVNQPPTNIPLNTVVQLQVNEPVDPGTVNSNTFQVLQGGQSVPGTYSVSTDGQTITFVPSSSLAASQSYTVNFSGEGITDLAGNMLMNAINGGPTNFSFTTGTSPSTNAPQVAGTSPATGATSIPINAHVVVQFNEPVNATKLTGVYLAGPGGTVAASQTLTNGNQTLTVIPITVLAAGTQYTMNIAGVQDMSGNVLVAPVTATFTTGSSADLNPPQVASTNPASYATGVPTSSTVQVQFSKAVDPVTVTASTFELFPYSTMIPVPGVISFSPDGTTVTFTPTQALDSATSYVISLSSGIIDLEGQTLQPMNYYFTTAQGASGLAPVIATMSPSAAGVGTNVTINGTYFGTSQGSSTVTFNGVPATVSSWSDVQIVASVPSGATTGPLVVTVNGTNSNTPQFDVTATPVITSISPSSATVGTVLTITGSNFGDAADSVGINFPQNLYPPPPPLTPITRTPTSITIAVPSAAMSGNVNVTVDNVSSAGSAFTFIPTPNIASLSTYSGIPGTVVNIVGTNFGSGQGSTVNFNGVPANVTSWGTTQVIAVAPGNVTTGPITIVANSVSSNSNVVFTVTTPAISSLSPPNAAAGAAVTLTGSGLAAQGLTTQVFFNGVAASVASASSNNVTVVVPANATSGLVTAVLGPDTSNGVEFTLDSPPAISAISPTTALYGGAVTITGSGFGATQSNSSVNFYLSNTAPQVQSWSDASLTVLVPSDATTGPLTVTVGGVVATAPSWFNVSTQTQITDSLGNQTTYTSTAAGGRWFSSSSSGPGCSTCTVRGNITGTPDANGNVLTSTDDLGSTTTYTYDSNSNVTSVSKPLNANTTQTSSYTYNSFGEVLTTTDPLGNVTTNTYDTHGNLLTVTTPAPNSNTPASVTQFQYATNGVLTQITDPKGNVTKLAYTPAGLIASITDAQNNVTSYQYDARGNRTAVIDPVNGASHPTSFAYDIMNRLTGITYPDGSTVGFAYDVRGRRTSSTDQNNRTTIYTYDDADRLTAVTDPANNTTGYTYDTEDNLLSITDANNHTTQFAYNARGWVTETTFPSALQESYTYDLAGHLLSKTDRKNQTIQYVYDALYRLASKTYPDSTSVEYAYDLAGKVLQVSDPTGTYGFAYDNMGRLIGTSTQYSYLSGLNYQNAYTYDANSNRTSLTTPDGSVTTYGYDTLNRLNGLGNSWAGSFGFSYDALSRRTSLTRPNGVSTNYSYDSVSHLLSVLHQAGSTVLDGASYTYDSAGNRLSKTNYLNAVTSNYGYDPLYELTQVTQGASTTESYSYDAVGNRLSSLIVPNYNYNLSNELTSNSNGSYTYDANGNTLTDASGKSYTWDFENRLTQAVVPGADGGTTTFKYDPFGRRIQKSGPLGTTNYLYGGVNSIQELDNAGNVVARYARTRNVDEALGEWRSGTASYYQQDGLDSITSLSNATGSVASTYSYDSYGRVLSSTGSLTNPFQYTGREFDSETGIYYYRARYFDPAAGRFLSQDPIQFGGGTNFYAYTRNRPVGMNDPLGLFTQTLGSLYLGSDGVWYNDGPPPPSGPSGGCTPAQWAQSPGACAGPQLDEPPYLRHPDPPKPNKCDKADQPGDEPPDQPPPQPPPHQYQNDPDSCTSAFEACVTAANSAGLHCANQRGFGLYGGLEAAGGIAGFALGGPAGALIGVEGSEMFAAGAGGIGAATCTSSADAQRIQCAQQEMSCLAQ